MTYRTLAELADTTQDELLPGIIDVLKKNDEWTASLITSARLTDRPTIKGNRLASAGTAEYIDCDSTITSVAVSGSPFEYDLETIMRQFDVCKTGQNLYSSFTDVVATELAGAVKAVGELIAQDSMVGDGSDKLAGLATQVTNKFNKEGASLDVGDIDRLYDEALSRSNLVYVGAPATIRSALAEIRDTAGGLTYDTLAGTQLRVPSYLGIPMLRNHNCDANKLYLVDMDQFVMFVGEADGNNIGGVFTLEDVGIVQNKHANRWRVYTQAATVLLDTQAAAELTIA